MRGVWWAVTGMITLLSGSAVRAQGAATVHGVVRAQSGQPLAGASVVFEPGGVGGESRSAGEFTLLVPAGTAGRLAVRRVGYAPEELALPALPAGARRQVAVTLAPLARLDVVTVTAARERPLLNTESAVTGGTVERAEIEALPTDARDPIALAYNIPGVAQATAFFGDAPRLAVNGANALYTQYELDGLDNNEGFLGGPRVDFPLAALERLSVHANTYSAEFGRSSNGVVHAESRAGTPRWTGEAFLYTRPGTPVDASPKVPLSADQRRALDGFRRTQVGGAAGGPLVAGRTFVFGAAEYTHENEDRIASTASTTFTGRELRETYKLFARLDHGWSETQSSTLRVAVSDVSRAGQGSGIVAPEADVTTVRTGSITALTHRTAMRGGRASNVASAQVGTFRWNFPPTRSDFATPQVTIVDTLGTPLGVVGSSNFVFDERELQLQVRNVFETALGAAHALRVGGDVARSAFELTGSQTNPSGAYVVVNEGNIPARGNRYAIADIPADVRVLSYTIDAAQKQVDLTQTLWGAFVEDRWRLSPALTLQAGVRWDYDDLTSRGNSSPDLDNVQPRLSFNWLASPTQVVRGGAGLYAGKFPYAVYSDAVQFGPQGNQTVRFEGEQAPPFLQGPRSASLDRSTLPPAEIRELFALGLEQPMSRQLSLGYQLQVGDRLGLSFDAVAVDTRNLPRSWDLNASTRGIGPADTVSLPVDVGDAFRPEGARVGSYRRHTTTESGGRSSYVGLYTAARYQASRTLVVDANHVLSRARNDTEDINFNATQGNDFGLEWADAINDRRHRATLRAVFTGVSRLTLSGIADFQSGTPVNRVAGRDASGSFLDLDGSGDTFGNGFLGNQDRFAGVQRNGERLPSAFFLSGSAAYRIPSPSGGVELRADVFNLLNSRIVSGFANGIPGGGARTQLGRPGDPFVYAAAAPPRQIQLSARYLF
jgi:hypothetical protein